MFQGQPLLWGGGLVVITASAGLAGALGSLSEQIDTLLVGSLFLLTVRRLLTMVVVKGKLHPACGGRGVWSRLQVLRDVSKLIKTAALPRGWLGLHVIAADVSVSGIRHLTVDSLVGDAASLLFHQVVLDIVRLPHRGHSLGAESLLLRSLVEYRVLSLSLREVRGDWLCPFDPFLLS